MNFRLVYTIVGGREQTVVSDNTLFEEVEQLLKRDSLLSDGRVSVNLTTEGKITTCWARRPTRRDRRRYRRLLNRARRRALSRGEFV